MSKLKLFTATWCEPCKNLKGRIVDEGLEWKVDILDIDDFASEAAEIGVRSLPTLVVEGQVVTGVENILTKIREA